MILKKFFLEPWGPMLLKVVLLPVAWIPELEFFCLHFSFWKLFGLFLSFFRGFRITRRIICRFRVFGLWFKLFYSRVLHDNTLNLYFGHGKMSKTIALLSLLVYLLDKKSRLGACFILNLDRFLDYFFSRI